MFLTGPRADADRSPYGDFWFQPVGNRTGSGVSVTADTALALTAVWACVRNIAEDFAKLPFRMYQPRASGGRDAVTDHWLYRLIALRPNAWQTPFEWREMMQAHLDLRGNAFNRLVVNGQGEITDCIPLHPDRVKLEVTGGAQQFRYCYTDGSGQKTRYARGDIWHIKGLSPDGYVGYSPVALQAEMLGVGLSSQSYAARFFANDARPSGGWVKHPGNFKDKSQRSAWRDSWQEQQAGVNRGKVAVLEYGMEYNEVGINNRDSQFIESRNMSVVEVARMFRVPPHKIQELSRATFTNIEQQNLEYATDCIHPRAERWEASIEFNLLGEDTQFECEFDLRSLMRGDSIARATRAATLINAGVLTRNEARDDEGLNPIEGLDEPLQPLNMVEAGSMLVEPAPAPAATPEPDGESGADARLAVLLHGNAQRLARRMVKSKALPDAAVIADAMAVLPASAAAWLATARTDATEPELVASLLAIEPCAEVERPDPMVAAFLEVASAVRAQPAPVVNLKVGDVTVNTSDRPVVVNVPPPVAMEKIAIRNADGVIEKLVERPVQQSRQP